MFNTKVMTTKSFLLTRTIIFCLVLNLASPTWRILSPDLVTCVDEYGGFGQSAEFFPILNYKMLKRRSQSTDITPLVNSAVEKLQELGKTCELAWYFVCFVVNDFDCSISKQNFNPCFLGQHVKASRHGVEPADPSGVEVVIKALKDLVIFIGRCVRMVDLKFAKQTSYCDSIIFLAHWCQMKTIFRG